MVLRQTVTKNTQFLRKRVFPRSPIVKKKTVSFFLGLHSDVILLTFLIITYVRGTSVLFYQINLNLGYSMEKPQVSLINFLNHSNLSPFNEGFNTILTILEMTGI